METKEIETTYIVAQEAAKKMGIKYRTLAKWCKQGKIPCLRPGKKIYIHKDTIGGYFRVENKETLKNERE